ncbi:MAG: circadian clock protein KaiC, partial [Desulfohalobiaceae bacterium]
MTKAAPLQKLKTGIPGLDAISMGGAPKNRTTLVAGSAGSGKTILVAQFLAEGIRQFDQSGVFVTFEEPPEAIRQNMISMGWDLEKWEQEDKLAFVDASAQVGEEATLIMGNFDMAALLARIEQAVRKTKASRVCLDSLGAVFTRFGDSSTVRNELFRITSILRDLEVTALMTAERTEEYGIISRQGVEEFVTDNVIILRNVLEEEKRRRTMEILKFRGATHQKGEFPFTILQGRGCVVIPLSEIDLEYESTDLRITSGSPELDTMCGGGFFRDSIVLVSGATGTGKTLMVTEFIAGGVRNQERCLLFAFEESREQFYRNASGWGVDLRPMEKAGYLKVVCEYPEVSSLEDKLLQMQRTLDEFQPHRVAIDSLSALERVSTQKSFREFVLGITSYLKQLSTAGLFTSTAPTLLGGESVTEAHISTLTDSIILLRYVEIYGEMRRGLTLLKMRGSQHDKNIREFNIDEQGMHIGKPFRNIGGILAGNPTQLESAELNRLEEMFKGQD